jgi:hypothetical protein
VCRPLLRLCRPFLIFEGCLEFTFSGFHNSEFFYIQRYKLGCVVCSCDAVVRGKPAGARQPRALRPPDQGERLPGTRRRKGDGLPHVPFTIKR